MADKSVQELYVKARKCIDVDHASDPVREPFRSLYAGAEHLRNALNNLKNKSDKSEQAQLAVAQILYDLGLIDGETEEAGGGKKWLQEASETLETLPAIPIGDASTPGRTLLNLSIINQLAIVDSARGQLEDALQKLKVAEALYDTLSGRFDDLSKLDTTTHHLEYLLGQESIPQKMKYSIWMEEEGTKSKYYLAQCYNHIGEKEAAAKYCHITLKKQLKCREFLSFFDPIDWALNAATLSQFYLFRDNYTYALHLLCCADFMMKKTSTTVSPDDTERVQWRGADVARCWIKYGVEFLEASKKLKEKREDGEAAGESASPNQEDLVKLIEDESVDAMENEWKTQPTESFEEARVVFLSAQKKVAEAVNYYSLKDRASDYVLIAQDSSRLYRDLAALEGTVDRKCKMHKRRINLLDEIVKILNPKYYSAELQQLHFELAETYTEMMELKYSLLPKGVVAQSEGSVNKINMLVQKAIFHYQAFLDLITEFVVPGTAGSDGIAKFEESYVRPALVARFSIGRLYSKRLPAEPAEQMENLKTCKKYYENVEAYVEKYPDHKHFVSGELEVMNELMRLLPEAMQNLIGNRLY